MRVVYASRLYVIQTIKKNSIADISISFMLFTIYKEIQIGFGKPLNQYQQKNDKIQNMTFFEKIYGIQEISGKLASLLNDHIPKKLTSGVVYKFECGVCNESFYGECVRNYNVTIGKHNRNSPLRSLSSNFRTAL